MALFSSSGPLPSSYLKAVPLFALPNIVLFPRAVLPLHVFEERYRTMTADALGGRRTMAMALLKPGWEKNYYGRPAIDHVVCLGEILNHEQLPDGKYNFLLQGVVRARIVHEHDSHPYRTVDLERLPETPVTELDLSDQRQRLTELLGTDFATFLPAAQPFEQLLAGPLPTADIADLIAFHLLDDVPLKQSLLAECDVRRRVKGIVDAVRNLNPAQPLGWPRYGKEPGVN